MIETEFSDHAPLSFQPTCAMCGGEIPDFARECPGCGEPIAGSSLVAGVHANSETIARRAFQTGIVLGIWWLLVAGGAAFEVRWIVDFVRTEPSHVAHGVMIGIAVVQVVVFSVGSLGAFIRQTVVVRIGLSFSYAFGLMHLAVCGFWMLCGLLPSIYLAHRLLDLNARARILSRGMQPRHEAERRS